MHTIRRVRRPRVASPSRFSGRAFYSAVELLESRCLLAQTTGVFLNDPSASDGYVLFAPNTSTETYLMAKDGTVVHQWHSSYVPGLVAYLLPDGSLIRDAAPHGQQGNGSINSPGAGGLLERFNWAGQKIWEFPYDSPTHLAHHDFEVMPNGNILLIAWELKSQTEVADAGRNPSLPGASHLYPDHIVEVQPDLEHGGGTIVWEWHAWDHLVQQYDASKTNWYGATGVHDHPELINLNYVSNPNEGGGQADDWMHSNGLDYNPQLDEIVLSVREFSEFWIIDHSTTTAQAAGHMGGNSGHGGDLLYRWGNPQTYDRGTAADRRLFFQHDARWVEGAVPDANNVTVFNNGLSRPGTDFNSVDEIAPPRDINGQYVLAADQPYGPAGLTFTYAAPVAYFSPIISGAQRLPNGNTLITYGVNGTMTEVTPAGQEVWKFVNPYTGFGTLGPEQAIPSLGASDPLLSALLVNFVFQANQYPRSYVTQLPSSVVGRQVFYNQSKFDGGSSAANASDDASIAIDKSAYLPGAGAATWNNMTSYSRGINGIMVDLLGAHGTITAADFIFKVGTNNTPSTWAAAPAPASVTVRSVGETDRVTITWGANAPKNAWLEVIVKGNDATGGFNTNTNLAASDIFFFGNKVGEVGPGSATLAQTTITDVNAARTNTGAGSAITNIFDFDRSGTVTIVDVNIARTNTGSLAKLNISSPPAAPQAAADNASSRNAVLAVLAWPLPAASAPAMPAVAPPAAWPGRQDDPVLARPRVDAYFGQLSQAGSSVDAVSHFDDELSENLEAGLDLSGELA